MLLCVSDCTFSPGESFERTASFRRKWIAKFAEGGPPWDAGCDTRMTPKEVNRDVLLDIYEVRAREIRLHVLLIESLVSEAYI